MSDSGARYVPRAGYARLPAVSDATWTPNYWRPDRATEWRPTNGALFQTVSNYVAPSRPPLARAIPQRARRPITTPMREMKANAMQRQQTALQHMRAHGGSMRVSLLRELTGWDPFQASQIGKALADKKLILRKHGYWVICETDRSGRRQPTVILAAAPPMQWRRNAILSHLRAQYPNLLTAGQLAKLIGLTTQQIRNAGRGLAADHLISRGMGKWRAIHPTETRKHD